MHSSTVVKMQLQFVHRATMNCECRLGTGAASGITHRCLLSLSDAGRLGHGQACIAAFTELTVMLMPMPADGWTRQALIQ